MAQRSDRGRRKPAKRKSSRQGARATKALPSPSGPTEVVDVEDETFRSTEPLAYFGTDFDVHGLVRRLNDGDIVIPSFDPAVDTGAALAGFQRGFVWKSAQMERFVESLLLGFPVPGIFLVQQPDRKLLVLDGQQRLKTLQNFYSGDLKLDAVADDLRELTYAGLDEEARRSLDNTFIHATIVKHDPGNPGDDAVYQLFERLNTGGTNLYPHEIRVALYSGSLVELIRMLNGDTNWRALFGPRSARLKDQELILRFLALYYAHKSYQRPLRGFLNHFCREHRNLEGLDEATVTSLFLRTCAVLRQGIGPKAFRARNAVNAALVDSVLVGVARRVESGPLRQLSHLRPAFDKLVADPKFQAAIGRATADEERVRLRLDKATRAFAKV